MHKFKSLDERALMASIKDGEVTYSTSIEYNKV